PYCIDLFGVCGAVSVLYPFLSTLLPDRSVAISVATPCSPLGPGLTLEMKQQNYVAQRPGCQDCEIASLATVTGHSYEEIAGVLGIAIYPTTGLPDLAKYPSGIDILDIVYPLFRLGWSAAVIVTREGFREAQVGNSADNGTSS